MSDSLGPHGLRLPGSSVQGVLHARILEWVAVSFSRGSSPPRDGTCISYVFCIGRRVLYYSITWEAQDNTYIFIAETFTQLYTLYYPQNNSGRIASLFPLTDDKLRFTDGRSIFQSHLLRNRNEICLLRSLKVIIQWSP